LLINNLKNPPFLKLNISIRSINPESRKKEKNVKSIKQPPQNNRLDIRLNKEEREESTVLDTT